MTTRDAASAMRRIADVFDKMPSVKMKDQHQDQLQGDFALGAASMVCYLRDLFTLTDRHQFSQAEVLIMLEAISRDHELFPLGVGRLMWEMEDEDELPA